MDERRDRQNYLRIRTPEGVEFSLLLASPLVRGIAWLIDAIVILVLVSLSSTLISMLGLIAQKQQDMMFGMIVLVSFAITMLYAILFEWRMRGRTPGKRAMSLQVVDANGLRLRFSQVVVRNLLRAVDFLPMLYLVGGITSIINRRYQRLGDVVANTVVIRSVRAPTVNLDLVLGGKFNSFRQYAHLTARLRQSVEPALAQVLLQALQRREALESEARITLYRELVDYVRELTPFPEDATLGLSDEQYLRNVVDIVFTSNTGVSLQRRVATTEPATDADTKSSPPASAVGGA